MAEPGALQVLVDDLQFPEAPRWRDGRLWFSDFFRRCVFHVGMAGDLHRVVDVPGRPSGLGWRPDGTLLVVSMHDHRVLSLHDGELREAADLSAWVGGPCNDLVVDAAGRAYVGNFGFDLYARAEPRPTRLLRVDADGSVHVAAQDLLFPNGMAITPDGRTLLVAETWGHRLTAFEVAADGSLSGRREFAALGDGCFPDGLCLDAEGAVWVAAARGRRVLRVVEGRGVVQAIATGDHGSYACMLGGDDGRTLFVCTAPGVGPAAEARREGRIEFTRVDVPHAGRP
jgi:sugar lactone lactonase YvrE